MISMNKLFSLFKLQFLIYKMEMENGKKACLKVLLFLIKNQVR